MTARCDLVADRLAFPEGPVLLGDGSILLSEVAAGRITRIDGVDRSTWAETGGGPNGLARDGDDLVVCQNGGSAWGVAPLPYDLPGAARLFRPVGPATRPITPQLQRVSLDGRVTTLATRFTGADGTERDLVRPSDICTDGAGGFYLTDGGTTRGRAREQTGLLHCAPDGTITEIVYPLEMPNGVALGPDGRSLYVAETRTRRVWRFEVLAPGKLGAACGLATVPSGGPLNIGGADGLGIDPEGHVVVATLGTGGVTVLDEAGDVLLQVPLPDPMTTNLVADPAGDRLLVTLASTGRLVAIRDWSALVARVRRSRPGPGSPARIEEAELR